MTTPRRFIDLNADLGEGMGQDSELLAIVSSASIACGGHAGDRSSMTTAVRAALAHGVTIGAHPSYRDREHFGRRALDVEPDELRTDLIDQVRELAQIATELGAQVSYLKPHGALYNTAMADEVVAGIVLDVAAQALEEPLPVLCLAGSVVERRAAERGLVAVTESFADRASTPEGALMPRSQPGAVLHLVDEITARVPALASSSRSICVHGDTPGAVQIAQAVRARLAQDDVTITSFAGPSGLADRVSR